MLRRLDLRGKTGDLRVDLPRPQAATEPPVEAVQAILAEVRERGDAGLLDLTERFDGIRPESLRVPEAEIEAALASIPPLLREALEAARSNVLAYHREQLHDDARYERDGLVVREMRRPVDRAGVYVPGGAVPLVSTVLMTAVPARVAGVAEVVLCSPPDRATGKVAPGILAAAALAGVDEVYGCNGPAAIGAMAYGTESIRAVDVIVGPGNVYVSQAKRQVSGVVGVPSSFAGPSEVVVVADETTPAEFAAIDLIVQVEHGPDGLAWLITWSEDVADRITTFVEKLTAESPRRETIADNLERNSYVAIVDGPEQAIELANAIAPEHLQLMTADPDALLPLVRHAGAVFTGAYAPRQRGRLHRRTEPRVTDLRVGPLRRCPPGRRLLEAHPRGLRRRGHAQPPRAPRRRHRRGRGSPGPRRVGSASEPAVTAGLPAPLDNLGSLQGYHSPQVDVDVRLNTNESPYGPPPAWIGDVVAELERIDFHRYPDRSAADLREGIAALHGVSPEQVFVANGSNEVLQTLFLTYGGPGRSCAVFEPTYAMHGQIGRLTSTTVVEGERGADFRLDLDEVGRVLGGGSPDLTFVCSPNNPTGGAEPRPVVEAVLDLAPGLVVVDEAYGQFSSWTALDLVGDRPLVVTRTYSKTWSMAGARLGYLVGPEAVVAELWKRCLPYHLDTLKQRAGLLALRYSSEMEARVSALVAERERLVAGLSDLSVETWPSDANFVLFRPLGRSGDDVWQGLVDRSVLVRNCGSWPRLDNCLRVTVGRPDEDDRFLSALSEVLA